MASVARNCLFALGLILGLCGASSSLRASEFTVVAYNLENVFDLDGVALFEDYAQDDPADPFGYSRHKLLTKLTVAVAVLAEVNDGAGPDVVLFQELENDFTPESSVTDFEQFLERYGHLKVSDMLGEGWRSEYRGISAVAWMLKAMADHGMAGYDVAVAPPRSTRSGLAHVNATFSRFPILEAKAHALRGARDILETAIEVDGSVVWVYNNHWKSGASNPEREPLRVENARVLRDLIDARLNEDPATDVIIGGDLNSHYNQSLLFPKMTTGINDVLGSGGDERFVDSDLYNLWFELPVEARYSEVWRGRRGTLMHLIASSGLYDRSGISYVDGSFEVLRVPDLNADALGRPLAWHFAGKFGGGASDHFPVMARFSRAPFLAKADYSSGSDAPDFEMALGYEKGMKLDVADGGFLGQLSGDELAQYVDRLFEVDAEVVQLKPLRLKVDDQSWSAFVPDPKLFRDIRGHFRKGRIRLLVRPGFWKGKRQLVVDGVIAP